MNNPACIPHMLLRLVTVIDYFLRYGYGYRIRLSVWYRGLRLFSYPCKYRKYRTFCKVTVFYGILRLFRYIFAYGYVRLCTVMYGYRGYRGYNRQ